MAAERPKLLPTPPNWWGTNALYHPENTLQRLVLEGHLNQLDPRAVKYNIQHHQVECFCGGEAEVHVLDWHMPPSGSTGSSSLACPIKTGNLVALKIHQLPDGRGNFRQVVHEDDVREKAGYTQESLRKEVNILKLLECCALSDRVPPVLGIVQHPGTVKDPPIFGYAMPTYRYGSLAKFIRNTCDRRIPEDVFANFFNLRRSTDISSNNLLIREEKDGCRLLLADPTTCHRACDLADPNLSRYIVSTWLWGSPTSSYRRFDATGDVYSLSFSFLELWLCAEGATVSLFELVQTTGVDVNSRGRGRAFSRALCVEVLRRHMVCRGAIVPRIKRKLPVSWLKLCWAPRTLLLKSS
ncbi:leucine-rich transmembrane [Chlorella sorokiniana]|uniref:Leucine-rich transmembrane n=1 Tax=Chlorella sorokiniana TaxID=3076 RepID=A0A2P6U0Y8_CHLSO|nr:leucine-rich transmembrane [Chlorella sorokiniana]|eukprot:PRW59973.1 leucine-rich transmembrane [Chlorella sorokiniana]